MRMDVRYVGLKEGKNSTRTGETWFYFPHLDIGLELEFYRRIYLSPIDRMIAWVKVKEKVVKTVSRHVILRTSIKKPILLRSIWFANFKEFPILYNYSKNTLLYFSENRYYDEKMDYLDHRTEITVIAREFDVASNILDKFINLITSDQQVFSNHPNQILL